MRQPKCSLSLHYVCFRLHTGECFSLVPFLCKSDRKDNISRNTDDAIYMQEVDRRSCVAATSGLADNMDDDETRVSHRELAVLARKGLEI